MQSRTSGKGRKGKQSSSVVRIIGTLLLDKTHNSYDQTYMVVKFNDSHSHEWIKKIAHLKRGKGNSGLVS